MALAQVINIRVGQEIGQGPVTQRRIGGACDILGCRIGLRDQAVGIHRDYRIAKGGKGCVKLRAPAFGWQAVNRFDVLDAGKLHQAMGQQRKTFRPDCRDIGKDMVGCDLEGADIKLEIRQHIDDVPRDADPVFPGDFKTHGCTEMFTL